MKSALAMAVAAITFLAAGCSGPLAITPDATAVLDGMPVHWLIAVYMNADNELEARALEDINELESAELSGSGIVVAVLLDRTPGYDASDGDWTGTRLYRVVHDPDGTDAAINSLPIAAPSLGIDPAGEDVELDLSSSDTLHGFLSDVVSRFNPEHTALVIWGHGSGFRTAGARARMAAGFDDTTGTSLQVWDVADGIAGHGVDVIGFDTSFSASIEVAFQLRDRARFMIGSQDAAPADGWEYGDILSRFAASPGRPADFASSVVESRRELNGSLPTATASAVDLNRIDLVNRAFNDFCDAISDLVGSAGARSDLRQRIFYDVEDFYATPGDLSVDLFDLACLCEGIYPEARDVSTRLRDELISAVVENWANPAANPRAGGLSVHFIPLGVDGAALSSHDISYFRGSDPPSPLDFVEVSTWVPALPSGPGLLHRLFYEVME